jgi:hypothetical protein
MLKINCVAGLELNQICFLHVSIRIDIGIVFINAAHFYGFQFMTFIHMFLYVFCKIFSGFFL